MIYPYNIGSRRLPISYETKKDIVFCWSHMAVSIFIYLFIYIFPSERLGEEYYFIQNLIDWKFI